MIDKVGPKQWNVSFTESDQKDMKDSIVSVWVRRLCTTAYDKIPTKDGDYMRLEAGDTISLRTGSIRVLEFITLCFELAQFDSLPFPLPPKM